MALSFLGRGGKSGTSGGSGGSRFAMLAEVRAYWEGLREGGALPERDRIDPRGIAGALENTFLLERVAPGIGRFRIAGMQLHDLMGMDVRGMPVSALFEPAARNRLSDGLEGVFSGPAVLELWLEAERGIGRPALEARMIVLPLTGAKGETDLALGCLAMEGALGRAPRRFAIAGLMSEVIERRQSNRPDSARPEYARPEYARPETARPEIARRDAPDRRIPDLPPLRALPPAALPPGPAPRPASLTPVQGFAEPASPFTPRPPRGKPNLRLVYSRD